MHLHYSKSVTPLTIRVTSDSQTCLNSRFNQLLQHVCVNCIAHVSTPT